MESLKRFNVMPVCTCLAEVLCCTQRGLKKNPSGNASKHVHWLFFHKVSFLCMTLGCEFLEISWNWIKGISVVGCDTFLGRSRIQREGKSMTVKRPLSRITRIHTYTHTHSTQGQQMAGITVLLAARMFLSD